MIDYYKLSPSELEEYQKRVKEYIDSHPLRGDASEEEFAEQQKKADEFAESFLTVAKPSLEIDSINGGE